MLQICYLILVWPFFLWNKTSDRDMYPLALSILCRLSESICENKFTFRHRLSRFIVTALNERAQVAPVDSLSPALSLKHSHEDTLQKNIIYQPSLRDSSVVSSHISSTAVLFLPGRMPKSVFKRGLMKDASWKQKCGSQSNKNMAAEVVLSVVNGHTELTVLSCDTRTQDLRNRAGLQEVRWVRTTPTAMGRSCTIQCRERGRGVLSVHTHSQKAWTPFRATPQSNVTLGFKGCQSALYLVD